MSLLKSEPQKSHIIISATFSWLSSYGARPDSMGKHTGPTSSYWKQKEFAALFNLPQIYHSQL